MKDYWKKNWFFLAWTPMILFVGYLFRTDDSSPYWFPWTVTVILGLACMAWYWQGPPKEGNDTSKEGKGTSKDRVLELKTHKEFLQKEYEKGEEVLATWKKNPHYTKFVEEGDKHQKEILAEISNTKKEIEMLLKESPILKSPTPWRTTLNVGLLLFLEVLVAASILSLWDPVNRPMRTPTSSTVTIMSLDTVVSRVSCDSTMQVITHRKITDSTLVTLMLDFTRDSSVYTNKIVASADTLLTYDPLTIDSLRCGDTVVVSKQSIPYDDRNASLTRINRRYIEAGKWAVKEDTIYRNRSPQVEDWEINDLFTKKRAQWHHTIRDTKYTLSLLHENKVDTLDSREDAQGLLEAKCKDAATKKKEFSYAEFNACRSNGSITKIKVPRGEVCGYAPVIISYGRGTLSSQPYGCWGSSQWVYEL